jgi:DNA-binding transcriptional regulator YiaG
MDKRYKPLTAHEQLKLRQELTAAIEAHPQWTFAQVVKHIRKTLRLTIAEMSKAGRVSTQTLKNIEASVHSPTLETVERLLQPFGLRLTVSVKRPAGLPRTL